MEGGHYCNRKTMILLAGLVLFMGISVVDGQVFTTTGERCVLPFIYMSRTYYTCIATNNDGVLWCSTTGNYDRDRRYGNCIGVAETESGRQCYTPRWSYKGTFYVGCTTVDVGIPWCGTNSYVRPGDLAGTGSWGFCKIYRSPAPAPSPTPAPRSSACDVATTGGTAAEGSDCIFPFEYNGEFYYACTGVQAAGAWCSITSNYAGKWGYCVYRSAKIRTTNGKECVFPLRYRGRSYLHCITIENNETPWCGTTGDYENDREHGNCIFPECR